MAAAADVFTSGITAGSLGSDLSSHPTATRHKPKTRRFIVVRIAVSTARPVRGKSAVR